jgi:hypothetical protein
MNYYDRQIKKAARKWTTEQEIKVKQRRVAKRDAKDREKSRL